MSEQRREMGGHDTGRQSKPRIDHLRERLRDPVYARAYEEYRRSVIANAEAAVRKHRRPIHSRRPLAPVA